MGINSGTRIGSYEITGLIGAGGWAKYIALAIQSLSRDVAVKVLPDGFTGERIGI